MSQQLTPRQLISILVEQCPSFEVALPSCPLTRLRAEPDVLRRKELVAALGEDEVFKIYEQHLECVCRICGG